MTQEQIYSQTNLMCAITDLLFGVVVLFLIFFLMRCRTKQQKLKAYWLRLFVCLEIAAVLGCVVHFWFPTGIVRTVIWIFLFPLLMETVVLFDLTAVCSASAEKRPSRRDVIFWQSIGAAGVAAALLLAKLFPGYKPISLLTALAVGVAVTGFALFIKMAFVPGRSGEKMMFLSFVPLLFGGYVEIKGNYLGRFVIYFDHNSVMHFCATLSMVIMFLGVRRSLKDGAEKEKDEKISAAEKVL